VKDLVRSKITPQLRKKLATLGPALITEHGKDIQHDKTQNPSAGFKPTQVYSSSSINKQSDNKASASTASSASKGSSVNVTTVTDNEEFRTSAEELYITFTDPQRIAAFTRAPPKVFEGAHEGAKFELFGGESYSPADKASLIPGRECERRVHKVGQAETHHAEMEAQAVAGRSLLDIGHHF